LTADGQALLVPNSTITLDFPQSVNALTDLTTKWTFDGIIAFEQGRQTAQFVFIQVSRLFGRIDFGLYARFPSNNRANAVKILKRINDLLVIRNINTEKTRHTCLLLNLYLPGLYAKLLAVDFVDKSSINRVFPTGKPHSVAMQCQTLQGLIIGFGTHFSTQG